MPQIGPDTDRNIWKFLKAYEWFWASCIYQSLFLIWMLSCYWVIALSSYLNLQTLWIFSTMQSTGKTLTHFCNCTRHCNGGKWVTQRTYFTHATICTELTQSFADFTLSRDPARAQEPNIGQNAEVSGSRSKDVQSHWHKRRKVVQKSNIAGF